MLSPEEFISLFTEATAISPERGLEMLERLRPRETIFVEGILAYGYGRLGMEAKADLHGRKMTGLITDRDIEAARADKAVIALCELPTGDLAIENGAIRFDNGHNNIPALLSEAGFDVVHVWASRLDDPRIEKMSRHAVAMVNCYADADMEGVLSLSELHGRIVLNTTEAVTRSRRDRVAKALGHLQSRNCVIPRTSVAACSASELPSAPVIARKPSSHSGHGFALLLSPSDAADALAFEFTYFTEFIDTRWPDGLYRKCRILYLCGEVMAEHMMVSDEWCVRSSTARPYMAAHTRTRNEELAFLASWRRTHPQIAVLVEEVAQATGLDFFMADLGLTPNGAIILFEANPVARIILESELDEEGTHLRDNVLAIRGMFERQVRMHGERRA
ncbi:hypothetical protein [Rhizobium leguminosarum]|uniref:hypothetical protein n=1 Tax=Rhizobium leguminosarum TaxID=384 RepID=UPI00103B151A|nr:hypothetical protein [Rhizobium leguminosarum]TCA08604.1 hypothetical protein E0H63_07315 [Rhizobium leguminosarum bv. viciae]